MAKVKNKKRNLSDKVRKTVSKAKTALNPFEVHINKEKLRVLGKKLKNDRGLPGVSRAKALKKRKHTLLPEYNLQNKVNTFKDKRIGERSNSLNVEEKNLARYAAVRMKQHKRKSVFNLADDEVLTHRGQTLSEIEKFDDPRSDEDEDEETLDGRKNGNLQSKFVEDAHFGGGMLKKSDGIKSHKDLIEQLIAESKKRKVEKQKQKEATLELTEKLDTEWKDLLPLVSKSSRQKDEVVKKSVDDYDRMMREMRFEAKGTVSDKLKTEDEIAKEEKEKLERLEQERLERMKGTMSQNKTPKHRSADDLDDNFDYDSDVPDVTLSYNEQGQSNVEIDGEVINPNEDQDDNIDKAEEGESDDDIDDDEENDAETESEDNLSDLKEDESESEDEAKKESTLNGDCSPEDKEDNSDNSSSKIKAELLLRKEMMEAARKELPYTYSLPESYEDLHALLKDKPAHHQSVIIERIIKCNHPSLKEGNKDLLGLVFVYLLQYINDISGDISNDTDARKCFQLLSCLMPQFFDLAQLNPENAHSSILEVLKEKQGDFRKSSTKYPSFEVPLFLKIVSCLFSTSDFKHQVVIPSIFFMEQMLTTCKVRTRRDVAYGLFLVSLILEYSSLSKRYLPATLKFLCGILHMAIPKNSVLMLKVLPPFKTTSTSLVPEEDISTEDQDLKLDISDIVRNKQFDNLFRIKAVNVAIGLLQNLYTTLHALPSCCEIFESAGDLLGRLPTEMYPKSMCSKIQDLISIIEESRDKRKLDYIVMEKKRPKALRLYEPNIERVFDGKKRKVQSKEKAERDKLLHKLKREQKGAMRELRRDRAFLGRVQINQKIQSDTERHNKVKRIYSEAAVQQHDLNAMDRKNSRKKK